jgi:hypothetical protein
MSERLNKVQQLKEKEMDKKSKSQVKEIIEAEVDKVMAIADTLVPQTATPAELDEISSAPTMTKTGEGITPEDLAAINKAKQKVGFTALRAQNAILESQMAELEQKNLTFSLFVKYRLTELDQINESTGEIIRGGKK